MRLLLIIILLTGTALADRRSCDRFYDREFVRPYKATIIKRRVPSYVRSFRALVAHAPRLNKRLVAYRTKRIRPRSTWGTFGWEKSVAAYRNKQQLELAKLFSLGVERSHLSRPDQIAFDIDFHTRFSKEQNCTNRKHPGRVSSFGETERLRWK